MKKENEINIYEHPYGFSNGDRVTTSDNNHEDNAMLSYLPNLGAWMVLYFDENDEPIIESDGTNSYDWIHDFENGFNDIEPYKKGDGDE